MENFFASAMFADGDYDGRFLAKIYFLMLLDGGGLLSNFLTSLERWVHEMVAKIEGAEGAAFVNCRVSCNDREQKGFFFVMMSKLIKVPEPIHFFLKGC